MKRELIPVILAKSFTDFRKRLDVIKKLRPKTQWIQIDVVDGKFVPWKTYNDPSKVKSLLRNINFEVDLMTVNPLLHAKEWVKAGAKRILFHVEPKATKNPSEIIEYLKSHGVEVGAAINAKTPLSRLIPHLHAVDCALILGVNPGKSGQPFQKQVLKKIRALHKKYPRLPIEVDGGVQLDNARSILEAGATRLAAASAIQKAPSPSIAYKKILTLINNTHI